MADKYQSFPNDLNTPVTNGYVPTKSDTVDLPFVTKAVLVGTAGHLQVTLADMADGSFVLLKNITAGVRHEYRIKRLWNTGTTAVDIVALY